MRNTIRKREHAYARLEGWGRPRRAPACFETQSQRTAAVEAPVLAARCDAPQHEGVRVISSTAGRDFGARFVANALEGFAQRLRALSEPLAFVLRHVRLEHVDDAAAADDA